ncbi:MAG: ParB/RepB/Spo0J family partition protein [Clostridiales bacterium]|nr:ParB/RepB/Spo0J family partition protein [Clostridiales bacterium]
MANSQGTSFQSGQILHVPSEHILPNPYQPRKNFNHEELQNLAQSIKENGILQPLTIRKISNSSYYELIAGERRLRASIMAGLPKVPCLLVGVEYQGSALYSGLESLERRDLDVFEEAESVARLISNFGMTQEEVGRRLGRSQSTLSNKLRLLKLPPDIRYYIQQEHLTERHARALLRREDEKDMWHVLHLIKTKSLNVSQTEKEIESMLVQEQPHRQNVVRIFRDVRIFVNTINNAVDTMRSAGIDANSKKTETEDYIEFTVRIPKSNAKSSSA